VLARPGYTAGVAGLGLGLGLGGGVGIQTSLARSQHLPLWLMETGIPRPPRSQGPQSSSSGKRSLPCKESFYK
jgi:hypothetical protein